MSAATGGTREIITVNFGHCGVKLGTQLWKQYCADHLIGEDGRRLTMSSSDAKGTGVDQKDCDYGRMDVLFHESAVKSEDGLTSSGVSGEGDSKFIPRNLFVDCEEFDVESMHQSEEIGQCMFLFENSITAKDGSGGHYSRGHYTVGKEIQSTLMERMRLEFEKCDSLGGVFVNHSLGGGTGSGCMSYFLYNFRCTFGKSKCPLLNYSVYPSPSTTLHTRIVEPYNAVLSLPHILEYSNLSMVFDNEAIHHQLLSSKLRISKKNDSNDYYYTNQLISKVISSMTSSIRFDRKKHSIANNVSYLVETLVPFPRLQFLVSSMAPLFQKNGEEYPPSLKISTTMESEKRAADHHHQSLMNECLNGSDSFLCSVPMMNPKDDPYLAARMIHQGNFHPLQVSDAVFKVKNTEKMRMVELHTGVTYPCVDRLPGKVFDDCVEFKSDRMVTMIGNNCAIKRKFKRLQIKFDILYNHRAFVHTFVGEGMESGEWSCATEDINFLMKDYSDVLSDDY